MKPLKVYCAGRYSSNNIIDGLRNISRGQREAAFLFEDGYAPYSPWADSAFVLHNPDGEYSKSMFYAASMVWLEASNAVLVISGDGDNGGVDLEIKRAEELGIPVFYNREDLDTWEWELGCKEKKKNL